MIWKILLVLWLIAAHWRFIWNLKRVIRLYDDKSQSLWKEKDIAIELIKAYLLFIFIWPVDIWFWYSVSKSRKPMTAREMYKYRNWRLYNYLLEKESKNGKEKRRVGVHH